MSVQRAVLYLDALDISAFFLKTEVFFFFIVIRHWSYYWIYDFTCLLLLLLYDRHKEQIIPYKKILQFTEIK